MIDLYPKEHKRIKNNFMILFNYINYQQHSLPMNGRVWPFLNIGYIAMFDRIIVNILNMLLDIIGITECVLPKSTLPDVSFSTVVHSTACRHGNALAELQLDQTPSNRKIRTTLGQGPHTMHVVR